MRAGRKSIPFLCYCILVLLIWGMVNYLNSRHHHRFDLTFSRQFTLSKKTTAIITDLKEPVTVTTLYRPTTEIFQRVKDLLEEYAYNSGKIKITHIDADKDRASVELLAGRLKTGSFELNTVIFECGDRTKFVPQSEIIKYPSPSYYGGGAPPEFRAEEAFTSAILSVTQEERKRVYFTTGQGERDTGNGKRDGISDAVELLRKQNFEVESLALLGVEKMPADCSVLVIAGPTKTFSEAERDVLRGYLDSGGKALVMLDPQTETGLCELLLERSVVVEDTMVVDPVKRLFFNPITIFADSYGYHPITKDMQTTATVFPLARGISIKEERGKYNAVALINSSEKAWGETNIVEDKASFSPDEDKKGPVSIAVAVSTPEGMRLVVFGDSDFISNFQLQSAGNSDLFLNCINWLVGQKKLISIGPKSPDIRRLTLSRNRLRNIFILTMGIIPLLVISSGIIVWRKRRR